MREIMERRSVRKYQDRPVEEDAILRMLEAARQSPSGSNTQPWRFIVIRDPALRERVAAVDHGQKWLAKAPVLIACVGDVCCRTEPFRTEEDSPQEELKQVIRDTAVATEHLLLEAEHLGLGACWTAWFRQDDLRPVLRVPESKYVCGVVAVGYPAETPPPRPRRALSELVHYETW